ncbi:ArsR family transcriptional regulator [Streptomyces sp. NPDC059009]|uniref:ArsR/SmtB family transcription factor n=1 Tax=Streptomyces sp. NPDC059009 TaxID=3346694 RepID=UPI0036AEE3FA
MSQWRISADTLAETRFTVSPLAETTACLFALAREAATHPGERAWLRDHLPAYRRRLAADPVTARLVPAATGDATRWIADFLTPAPSGEGERSFADEVAEVRAAPAESARADLTVSHGGPLPAELRERSDLPDRAADLLEWVWETAVLPDWPRRRRIIEADVLARTAQLGQGGWVAALAGMRPGMRWLGESTLQVNTHVYPPRDVTGARLLFVPVTPTQGWVSWRTSDSADATDTSDATDTADVADTSDQSARVLDQYAVIYPCSGALADVDRTVAPKALARLLGPGRAAVLMLLATPKSTTQLVALTGQALGSVGRHLRVLLDAGLAGRRRAGRSVLYFRTGAGEVLVKAQSEGAGARS